MSDQFYDYLAENIIDYFQRENNLKSGYKFYKYFDDEKPVKKLYESLKKTGKNRGCFHEFHYLNYSTFYLDINGIKLVIVEDSEITGSFVVKLRNQTPKQKDEWENTALLVICFKTIESIDKAMRNLEKDNMPLNINQLSSNLKSDIEENIPIDIQRKTINFALDNLKNEFLETITLFDFETILSIIKKGEIERSDFKGLNLFPDNNLDTADDWEERLIENTNTFNEVAKYHQYSDLEEKLKKIFDDTLINDLKSDGWEAIEWKTIKESKIKHEKKEKPLEYKDNEKLSDTLNYWQRKDGKNKYHIIIFKDSNSEISLDLKFSDFLKQEFFLKNPSKIATNHGKTMNISFKVDGECPVFKQISYKHNNNNKSHFIFNIVVINSSEDAFKSIKSSYKIYPNTKLIEIVPGENNENLSFGNPEGSLSEKFIEEPNELFILEEEHYLKLSDDSPYWDGRYLNFRLQFLSNLINFRIKGNPDPKQTNSLKIYQMKNEYEEDFIFNKNKAVQGVNNFYLEPKFKKAIKLEQTYIKTHAFYGKIDSGEFVKDNSIHFNSDLEEAYIEILNYFIKNNNVPSLVHIDEELYELYKNFISIFNKEIENIETGSLYDNPKKKNLIKLGRIDAEDKILYTSLSPINIAYQLELYGQCGKENIDLNIRKRLNPVNLVPYVYSGDTLYKSVFQTDAWEWLEYKKISNVSIGSSNDIISNVVKKRIEQFIKYFPYLFEINYTAPLKLNIINILNDEEIVKGVFDFIKSRLEDSEKNVIPIEINIYNESLSSSFDNFFECRNVEDIEETFKNLKVDSENYDSSDIIRLVQNNIKFYKHGLDEEYNYSHISFYKVNYSNVIGSNINMSDMSTGLSLNGLISSISLHKNENQYKSGFGIKYVSDKNNLLFRTAKNINELAINSKSEGHDQYHKNESIATSVELDNIDINELYKSSHWVTFIEPNFDIEYFDSKDNNTSENLIIIHYSDQFTSSNNYDTFTVTNRFHQFKDLISKVLKDKTDDLQDNDLISIIKMFNSINGDWLLKLMSDESQFGREKISLVAAIKYVLAILHHENIIWIPVSLEEILRIAGGVNLSTKEGLFFSQFKEKKVYSDDLLFMGLDFNNKDRPRIIYYPTEVKIGTIHSNIVKKGREQLNHTYELFNDNLLENENNKFKSKFYRNFLIQIFLSNAKKLYLNDLLEKENFNKIEEYTSFLLNDEYDVKIGLYGIFKKFSLVMFEANLTFPEFKYDNSDDMLRIHLPEKYAYKSIDKSIGKIIDKVQNDETDISTDYLLSNLDDFNDNNN